MPLARLRDRLIREEQRSKEDERRRRHESWTFFSALFYAHRGESEAPMTKEEFQKKKAAEKSGKSEQITDAQWRDQALARKAHERIRETYHRAAQSLYYFEEAMGYASHLFERPEEPEHKVMTAQELKDQERFAQQDFIAGLQQQVGTR